MTTRQDTDRLKVLSDMFESMFGLAIDFSLWTPDQLARVVNNPEAVRVLIGPVRSVVTTPSVPIEGLCHRRMAQQALLGEEYVERALVVRREYEINHAGPGQDIWRRQLENCWDTDRAAFEAWKARVK